MQARKPLLPFTEKEEVQIQAGIASDPENPELTDAEIASLRPFREVFPDLADAIRKAVAGRAEK